MLAVVAFKQPAIECLTFCLPHGMIEVTLSYCHFGNYVLDGWACLCVNPLNMPRTLYWAEEEHTLNNPPCPIAPPSPHHLYIGHLINGLHCFYRIKLINRLHRFYPTKLRFHVFSIRIRIYFNITLCIENNHFHCWIPLLCWYISKKYIAYVAIWLINICE